MPNIRRTLLYLYRLMSVKQSLRFVIPRAQNLTFIVVFMQKVVNWKGVVKEKYKGEDEKREIVHSLAR